MSRRRYIFLPLGALLTPLLLSLLVPSGSLSGQELPWLRAGRVRLDFAPVFWGWDSRFGLRKEGSSIIEEVETLGSDLTADPLGSPAIPHLRDLEANLADALEDPEYRVRLGVSQALVDQSRMTFPFRLEVGVTDWLTVGAMVPLVRTRSEITFDLVSDSLSADVGLSPNLLQAGAVASFLEGLQTAVDSATVLEPENETWSQAQGFLDALSAAYTHNSFFPVLGSAAGTMLQERLGNYLSSLEALGIAGAPTAVPLAGEFLDAAAFREFLTSQSTNMRGWPFENWTAPWALGDVEITASARLLRGGFEADSLGEFPFLRYQVGGGLLFRLGTGEQADPNRFLPISAGDGQADMEAGVFGLVQLGGWFGAWGHLRLGFQQEGDILRRIAAPSEVFPNWLRLAPLKWTPGNYRELDLNPRIYLNPAMTFGIRYHFWSKEADQYALGDIDPEVLERLDYPSVELLEEETEETLHEVGLSATFSTLEPHARGEASLPLHIRVTYFRPVSGSGGQTPKGGRFEAGISLFRQLWGGPRMEQAPNNVGGR
ncbi:hypothetical protein ACFL3S_07770 [Gemmatimonadota bacterium]